MHTLMCFILSSCLSTTPVAHEKGPQSSHLLASVERYQFARHRPLHASDHRRDIAGQQHQPSDDKRPPGHLVYGSEEFPNRMASKSVVQGAISELHHQYATLGRPVCPM